MLLLKLNLTTQGWSARTRAARPVASPTGRNSFPNCSMARVGFEKGACGINCTLPRLSLFDQK